MAARKPPKTLEYQGKTQTVSQWAAETGLDSGNIYHRIKLGWPAERILTEPVRPGRRKKPTDTSLIGMKIGDNLIVKEKISSSDKYIVTTLDGRNSWLVNGYELRNTRYLRITGGSPIRARFYVIAPFEETEIGVVNLNAFCEVMKLDFNIMLKVADGHQASHKGWKCRKA